MDRSAHLKLQYFALIAAVVALITGLYNGLYILTGLSGILILTSFIRIRKVKSKDETMESK